MTLPPWANMFMVKSNTEVDNGSFEHDPGPLLKAILPGVAMADDLPPLHRRYNGLLDRQFWMHVIGYALLWLLLTATDLNSWIIGGPTVLLAAFCSRLLSSPLIRYPRPTGLFFFGLFFLGQSLLSGLDVIRRTLSRRLLLTPGLVPFKTFLPEGTARVLFANTISLLPGTLSVDLEGNTIIVHTLDIDMPVWANLQNLERHIAVLFRLPPKQREDRE
jgi:multicomponent Na+:H+ antiporter subunit E